MNKYRGGFVGIVAVIVVGVLALGGYAGYRYMQRSGKGMMTNIQNKKGAVMEKIKDCMYDKDYCMYMQTGLSALSKSMVGKSVITTKDGTTTTSTWETDGKGNMRITTMNGTQEQGSIIMLDGVMYMKDQQKNVWYEYASGEGATQKNNFFDVESLKKQFDDTKSTVKVTKKGTESCGSMQCTVFDISGDNNMGVASTIYIDTQEYLMRKVVTQTEQGTTMVEFEYKPVTIAKPSPVQQMAIPKISGMNQKDIEGMMEKIQNGAQ